MTRIRFRSDSQMQADDAGRLARGHATLWFERKELRRIMPAVPGDCWRVRWAKTERRSDGFNYVVAGEGPIAGYAICCPLCLQVHNWTSARNCARTVESHGVKVCPHAGISSCWQWTGSAEEGTLTASPSLHSIDDDGKHRANGQVDDGHGCGWHGWLKNGLLTL